MCGNHVFNVMNFGYYGLCIKLSLKLLIIELFIIYLFSFLKNFDVYIHLNYYYLFINLSPFFSFVTMLFPQVTQRTLSSF